MNGNHAGFISWDIYIFNNKQTKYLNIDRDQLKKGAITEEELLQIRSNILVEWCEYLIGANGNQDADFKNAEYLLHKDDNILLSLLILFYQCCEREQFDRFIDKYGSGISDRGLVIGDENILVTDLWNDSKRFFTALGYLSNREGYFYECTTGNCNPQEVSELGNPISLSTLHHFPHRLIQEISLKKYGECKLSFSFRFAHTLNQNRYVEMDDYARMLDYIFTIRRRDRRRQFSVKGIEKSVLKPDSKYPHLIVDRYPVTFQLNDSISHYLNECIKSYIISPFDANSLTLLNECIMKYPDEELGKSLMDHILTSEMYSNCEKYILKHSIYGEINLAETPSWKAFIKKEYTEFITDFCRILHENMNEVKSLLAKEINN